MMSTLNFANTDYAALNNDQWNGLQNCGRCAEVTCADSRCADQTKSAVVQILDRCPECKHGDLDLSPSVFTTLTGSDPSRYTIKWRFVDCPVAGNVNYCLKGGSNNYWTAIQPTNVVTGVTSLKINGQATKMLDGAYYYLLDGAGKSQTDLSKVTVSLTDINGVSIQDTVSLSSGSCTKGAHQFPSGGSKSPPPTNTSVSTTAPTKPATPTVTPKPTTATPKVTKAPTVTTQTPTTTIATPSPEHQTPAPMSTPTPTYTTAPSTGSSEDPTQQSSNSGKDDTPDQSIEQGSNSESNDVETQAPTTPNAEQPSSSIEQEVPATVAPSTPSSSGSQQSQTPEQPNENASSASFYIDCGSSNRPYEQKPSSSSDDNPNQESQQSAEQDSNSASVNGNTENPIQQSSGSGENPTEQSGESDEIPTSMLGSNASGSEDQPDQTVQQDASAVGADADFDTDAPEQFGSTDQGANSETYPDADTPNTEAPSGTANCPM
ncbi:hypothetical protein PHMEG_00010534 [Phytophthora megakarya]|uniref:Expansin-like EG45 domain-containing protein n=1 Tax=Phytophthora megakarya TaxID=4795 RepID=A0A225WEG5_9STRA|nr:hypothetical protein PHMEG_00010534 [Phytophthora megakarya]